MSIVLDGFTSQESDALLAEGRELVKRDNQSAWDWGDAALRVYPIQDRGGQVPGSGASRENALRQWMREIECPHEEATILSRRQVAAAWKEDIRISSSPWSVHQVFMTLDDRAVVIRNPRTADGDPAARWTVQAARAYVNAVKRDATTRTDILEQISSRVREPVKQGVTSVISLLETLTVPIPETGVTGKTEMMAGIIAARAALDLLEAKINGGDIDAAIEDILRAG